MISLNTRNKYFKNDSLIYLRAFDAASSYLCPDPIIGFKIPK